MNPRTITMGTLAVLLAGLRIATAAATSIDLDTALFSGGVTTSGYGKGFTDAGLGVVNRVAYCSPSAAATLPDTIQACATLVPALLPQPGLTVTLTAYPFDSSFLTDNATESFATGELAYFFAVIGPPTSAPIPITLHTFVEVDLPTGTAGMRYSGGIRLDAIDIHGAFAAPFVNIGPGWPTGIQLLNGYAMINTQYDVALILNEMDLLNFSSVGFSEPSSTKIIIDPILDFGPGFDSTGYSLVFSDGVGNGAASTTAPEPGTGALLGLAAAALLCQRHRSRKSAH